MVQNQCNSYCAALRDAGRLAEAVADVPAWASVQEQHEKRRKAEQVHDAACKMDEAQANMGVQHEVLKEHLFDLNAHCLHALECCLQAVDAVRALVSVSGGGA